MPPHFISHYRHTLGELDESISRQKQDSINLFFFTDTKTPNQWPTCKIHTDATLKSYLRCVSKKNTISSMMSNCLVPTCWASQTHFTLPFVPLGETQ